MRRRPRSPRLTRPPRVSPSLLLLGFLACQAGAGGVGVAVSIVAMVRGSAGLGQAAAIFVVSLVALVLFSVLLRAGVRSWVAAQPPDPPRAG